jgi:hypothetical protein
MGERRDAATGLALRRLAYALVSVGVAGAVSAVPGLAAGAEVAPVKSVGTPVPLEYFSGMELDEDRGRIYFAQGVGSESMVVTDLDGQLLTRVTAAPGVSDVVLSDDQRSVLVAQQFDRVAVLDADSLTLTATYAAPEGTCVRNVEPSGDKIVGGFVDCGIGFGGLLVWSTSTPGAAPSVYREGPHYSPIIDASPGAPGLVVAADDGYSPANTYVIDVAGSSPSIVSRLDRTVVNIEDFAISPDGTEVVKSDGGENSHVTYRELSSLLCKSGQRLLLLGLSVLVTLGDQRGSRSPKMTAKWLSAVFHP